MPEFIPGMRSPPPRRYRRGLRRDSGAAPDLGPSRDYRCCDIIELGYILWTTDRLTSMSRVKAATARGTSGRGQSGATFTSAASSPLASPGVIPATAAGLVSRNALAPRFAACYKIAMSFGMGYMLVMML
jgi:hypothetical protein